MRVRINVYNRHKYKGPGIYVGRPHLLSNPYALQDLGRLQAVKSYGVWLRSVKDKEPYKSELLRMLNIAQTGELNLICSCDPLLCHAHILRDVLKIMAKENQKYLIKDGEFLFNSIKSIEKSAAMELMQRFSMLKASVQNPMEFSKEDIGEILSAVNKLRPFLSEELQGNLDIWLNDIRVRTVPI